MENALTRDEFIAAYKHYMDTNGYTYGVDWEPNAEWNRYARGRSWFIPHFHGERSLAVITQLTGQVF